MTLAGSAGQDEGSLGSTNGGPTTSPPASSRAPYRWSAAFAAVIALGLGVVAAVMLVAGHHPWDGQVIMVIAGSHGLHRGDILAVGPALVSIGLAWWCARQGRVSR